MCNFCENQEVIKTKIWDSEFDLWMWIESYDDPTLLDVRLGNENVGNIKPFKIKFCPFCGESLEYLKHILEERY